MVRVFFAAALMLSSLACGGADTDPSGQGGGDVTDDDVGGMLPPSDNDSDHDDGSAWPKWKNPCPGPACDPPRDTREWVVDPPPDDVVLPAPLYDGRGPRQVR